MSGPPMEATEALSAWVHRVEDIPERGLAMERSANEAELAAVARALDIPACHRLDVTYRLKPLGGGRYRLTGTLAADVTQSCIVTLEPIDSDIRETFEEEYWPPELLHQDAEGKNGEAEQEILSQHSREVIEQGSIAVGRLVYEQIATALDPYPRRSDAAFQWQEQDADAAASDSPFAVLARLKDPK